MIFLGLRSLGQPFPSGSLAGGLSIQDDHPFGAYGDEIIPSNQTMTAL